MRATILLAMLGLAACDGDETLYSYGAAGGVWHLEQLDGDAYPASVVLRFPEPGRVSGQAPCNGFEADQTAPYPWFALGPIAATKRACPALADEQRFLAALSEMSLSELLGDTLILSNDDGRSMIFTRARGG